MPDDPTGCSRERAETTLGIDIIHDLRAQSPRLRLACGDNALAHDSKTSCEFTRIKLPTGNLSRNGTRAWFFVEMEETRKCSASVLSIKGEDYAFRKPNDK